MRDDTHGLGAQPGFDPQGRVLIRTPSDAVLESILEQPHVFTEDLAIAVLLWIRDNRAVTQWVIENIPTREISDQLNLFNKPYPMGEPVYPASLSRALHYLTSPALGGHALRNFIMIEQKTKEDQQANCVVQTEFIKRLVRDYEIDVAITFEHITSYIEHVVFVKLTFNRNLEPIVVQI